MPWRRQKRRRKTCHREPTQDHNKRRQAGKARSTPAGLISCPLLPSDAQISDQISFLEETAISMNRVKERIKETGVAQVLVLLDACRNDPGGRADAPNPLTNVYTSAFDFDVRNREVQAFATVYATGFGQRAYEYTEKQQGYFS